MAGIQLSGLASGLDWKSLVDQLMTVNSVGVTRLQTEQTTTNNQATALNSMKTKMADVQTALAALSTASSFTQRTATASNTLWKVTAQPTATPVTHTIAVTKLATTASLQGAGGISSAIRPDGDTSQALISGLNLAQPITAGQFSVNGAKVSVAVTDTLADVFQKISDATGGAVTASYDAGTDKVSLSSGGTIVLGSANDSSNFLQSLKLNNTGSGSISSTSRLGATKLDSPIASGGLAGALSLDADNAGKLSINGVEISFDADTDSLRTVISKINASSAGVTASYDSANDRMVLTNNVTGDLGVSIQDSTGNLASVLGLTSTSSLVRGQNAEFTVDGGTARMSASNALDENALGIAGLSVTLATQTTEQVTVGSDTSSTRTKLDDFISKFNEVLAYADQMTKITSTNGKVTTGLLYGNGAIKDVASAFRSELFKAVGGSGAIQRMEALGIDFNGTTNTLKVKDSAKLDSMLSTKSADVADFFTNSSTGLVTRMNTLINNRTGADGTLTKAATAKTDRSSKITTQISDMQRRLAAQRAALEASFIQMESMQSTLKNQLTALQNAFPDKSTSSSSN